LEPRTRKKLGAIGEQKAEFAGRALQGMGTNCLPFLLLRLGHYPLSPLDRMLLAAEGQLAEHKFKPPWTTTPYRLEEQNEAAAEAFSVLGHQAAPAVSELRRRLCSPYEITRTYAADALACVHPEGTAALIEASTNRTIPHRRFIFDTLHFVALERPEVFAALIALADDPDADVRAQAANILTLHPKEGAVVLPVLIRLLTDPDSLVRASALLSFGRVKGDLRAAEPALTALAANPDSETSRQAKALLQTFKAQSATPPPAP
jgi:HEAT repeat protein